MIKLKAFGYQFTIPKKDALSAGFTYGGFGIVWYETNFLTTLGIFCMILGFIIWNSKENF